MTTPDISILNSCLTTKMNKVRLCPNDLTYTNYDEISEIFLKTVIISEDAGFYSHSGFDFSEIKNSLLTNFERGGFARGGSTISQQFVKNVFLSAEKSVFRKLKEAYLTLQIENKLKKNEIFERYLNIIEFGHNIYGIRAAALHYFNKAPAELNLLESAFLSFLLPNPKKYSQSFSEGELSEFARSQVMAICEKLHLYKKISDQQLSWAQTHIDEFPWATVPYSEL